MSVSYAPTSLKVPDGFGRVLEDLTREVLRIQPDNIYEFAADHFKGKLLMREQTGDTENGASETLHLQEAVEEKIDINLSDPEMEKAAIKIQASFRGHQVREKTKQNKEEVSQRKSPDKDETNQTPAEEEIDINLDDPEVQQAAVKLQAGFRGFQARKSLRHAGIVKTEASEEIKPREEETSDVQVEEVAGEQQEQTLAEGTENQPVVEEAEDNEGIIEEKEEEEINEPEREVENEEIRVEQDEEKNDEEEEEKEDENEEETDKEEEDKEHEQEEAEGENGEELESKVREENGDVVEEEKENIVEEKEGVAEEEEEKEGEGETGKGK
jgi:hypothetical protein